MLNTTNTDTVSVSDLARLERLLADAMESMRSIVARTFTKDSHRIQWLDDAVQAACLKIWASPERYLAADNFTALAVTTAKNTAIDMARLAANGGGRFSHCPTDTIGNPGDKEETADNGSIASMYGKSAGTHKVSHVAHGEDGRATAERFADLDALHKAIDAALAADERAFVLALLDGAEQQDAAKAAGWSAAKASRNRDGIMARLAAFMA